MRNRSAKALAAALAVALLSSAAYADDACMTSVQQALDSQRTSYIESQSDLAERNYSKRPGSFAATTCLGDLMTEGGLDIFFKPPSLDSILNMVVNLACQQASQIFDQLLGGSGLNGGGSLNVGEFVPGVNLGGNAGVSVSPFTESGSGTRGNILEIFR